MLAKRAAPVWLSRGHRLLISAVGVGLWTSGGLWLIFHYFLRTTGEWGSEPNVLEPWWLKIHGLFAFLALWTLGLVWGVHIVKAWHTRRRRWSGPTLLAWVMAQAITGYLLLYVGDDGPWGLVSPTHWVSGLALPLVYGVHRLLHRLPAPKRDDLAPSNAPE